jgi:hypothetical protein
MWASDVDELEPLEAASDESSPASPLEFEDYIQDSDDSSDDADTLHAHLAHLRAQTAALRLQIERHDLLASLRQDPLFAQLPGGEQAAQALCLKWQTLKEQTSKSVGVRDPASRLTSRTRLRVEINLQQYSPLAHYLSANAQTVPML